MKKIITVFALCMGLIVSPALAHHPTEDILDEELFLMIDSMVSDVHAAMEFDDVGGMTIITTNSVSDAEDLIDDGLLADLSLLDDEVTVTITFEPAEEVNLETTTSSIDSNWGKGPSENKWKEWMDWGGKVVITIDTLLKVEENE